MAYRNMPDRGYRCLVACSLALQYWYSVRYFLCLCNSRFWWKTFLKVWPWQKFKFLTVQLSFPVTHFTFSTLLIIMEVFSNHNTNGGKRLDFISMCLKLKVNQNKVHFTKSYKGFRLDFFIFLQNFSSGCYPCNRPAQMSYLQMNKMSSGY